MAAGGEVSVFFRVLTWITIFTKLGYAQYYITSESPETCARGETDTTHEFFDMSQLQCTRCAQTSVYQTVSEDGLRCICREGMYLTQDFGGAVIECQPCPANMLVASNGWQCVSCDQSALTDATDSCPVCNSRSQIIASGTGFIIPILVYSETCLERPHVRAVALDRWSLFKVERQLDGSWSDPANPSRECSTCAAETIASDDGTQCERCNQVLSMIPSASDCLCPAEQLSGGVCFASPTDLVDDNSQLNKVRFSPTIEVDSAYFFDNIRAAQGMCQPAYGNLTACMVLSNMCVLLLYSRQFESSNTIQDACSAYLALTQGERVDNQWPENMPWLYYLEDPANQILSDTRITTEYTFPDMTLNFKAAEYALNGSFLGIKPVTGGLLQLCKDSDLVMDAAYNFGTTYEQECELSTVDLYNEEIYPLTFFDLYLEYASSTNGDAQLYAIPVLLKNFENANGLFPNIGEDRSTWELVRRFFLVDNISGRQVSSGTEDDEEVEVRPQAVHYVSSMILYIQLQEDTRDGRIYPPYMELEYDMVTLDDYNINKKVKTTFKVIYSMNLAQYDEDVAITSGVLCALAVLLAGVQTWGWSKRGGKIAIDFLTLIKFFLYTLNDLANIFFVIALGSSLWWLIFYKQQTSVYLILPNSSQEGTFIVYVAVAFTLKAIHMLHMIIEQISVDVFFVDWERPRGKVSSANDAQEKGQTETPVSIWRTYFIANEWNEIQTTRKINDILQIFAVVFFLDVVGFKNLATADPQGEFSRDPNLYYAPYSRIFRFAVSGLVYIIVGVVQYIFYTFIYERFVEDKVRQYVDLCSMSNVSVFVLANAQFGYYIHGRSVHGRADTDMREMSQNMKREEEDLCGQRGLLPNTEQQTFQIAVPRRLRTQYDKVMMPIYAPQQGAGVRSGGPGGGQLDSQTEKVIDGYRVLNRFLQAFIDHALRDVDYIIKDKLLFESILDVEFQDASDKGFFYNDSGHSFDAVLFYGNEMTIFIFEILTFGVCDLMSQNFVLAGVLTYLVMELISMMRDSLGRSNLAKKTLVDKRFLI